MTALILTVLLAQAVVPVTTVLKTEMSALESGREVVVRTPAEWAALWKEHEPARPAPEVNFDALTVLAVFLGSRATGGYSVEIVAARVENGELVVEYEEKRPARDAMVAQVLTSPAHVVSIPKHAGGVRFVKRQERP